MKDFIFALKLGVLAYCVGFAAGFWCSQLSRTVPPTAAHPYTTKVAP